jgi:RHS repeat-associated protein
MRRIRAPISVVTLSAFLANTLGTWRAWSAPDEGEPQGTQAAALDVHSRSLTDRADDQASGIDVGSDQSSFRQHLSPSRLDPTTSNVADLASKGLVSTAPNGAAEQAVSAESLLSLPTGSHNVTGQAISLPSGPATVGGMGESFTAQLSTGIATFNVPFTTPSVRGASHADFGISYSSGDGAGIAGIGWSIVGHQVIARQTDRSVPSYDDREDWHPNQDRFLFGGLELVPICRVQAHSCGGSLPDEVMPSWSDDWQYFRAHTDGAFLRFFWSPNHTTWRVQSKDGTHWEFGIPLDGSDYDGGLERNPLRLGEIYRWHLVRQYDAHGEPDAIPTPLPSNPIVFRYQQDGGMAYLAEVYETPPVASPITSDLTGYAHHITFRYEQRPDPSISYRSGWAQEQRLRLQGVDVASKPFSSSSASRELVRRHHLSYDESTHASLLTRVQVEGRCDLPVVESGAGILPVTSCPRSPALTFEYKHAGGITAESLRDHQGRAFEALSESVETLRNSPPHSLDEALTTLVDIDANGLPDVLVTAPALFGGSHGVYFGGSGGQLAFSSAVPVGVTGPDGMADADPAVLTLKNPNMSLLDFDANGSVDIVHMPHVRQYSVFSIVHSGDAWSWVGRPITLAPAQDPTIDFTRNGGRVAITDVNGDGLVDMVFSGATQQETFFSLGRYPVGDGQFGHATWTTAASAAISNDPVATCLPWSAQAARFGDPDVKIADMNGDGLPDVVRLRAGQVMYWPGRGNGFWGTGDRSDCHAGSFADSRHVAMANAPQFGVAQPGSVDLADVNGDGLADLIEIRFDAVDIYLNDSATGWTDRRTLSKVPIKANGSNIVRLTDVNGSGTADLLWGRANQYEYIDLAGGVRPHLLTKVSNGLGKTTELAYSSSTELMLADQAAGRPWSSVMPLSVPVVVSMTVRDNLEQVGLDRGEYVTRYRYRDPVFEGRDREFRGFRTAETTQIGDANSPTSITTATYLLGECKEGAGFDCSPSQRWKDTCRAPLRGLMAASEVRNEGAVYISTSHWSYELRQLYDGRDGRCVATAFPVGQDSYFYDTTDFHGQSQDVTLPEVVVHLTGTDHVESGTVSRRTVDAVRVASTQSFDSFGNPLESNQLGCIEGCVPADEHIVMQRQFGRPDGDDSGWLWRQTGGFTTGAQPDQHRSERHLLSDRHGDLVRATAILGGTLALDRFHADGRPVAPAPENASGGIDEPVEIVSGSMTHDVFGNLLEVRGANHRCRAVVPDSLYAEFPVREVVYGGPLSTETGCGERAFATTAEYDRGLGVVLSVGLIAGQPTKLQYDGFGRITAKFVPNPDLPGELLPQPFVKYEYRLPEETGHPYTILRAQTLDDVVQGYRQQLVYTDGLGRVLVRLAEADRNAGDEGAFVASGHSRYDAKGAAIRTYQAWFTDENALQFGFDSIPASTRYASERYDAFSRPIETSGLDGQIRSRIRYHALSRDLWDPEDIGPGPHAGSFMTQVADGHGRVKAIVQRVHRGATLELYETRSEYLPTGEPTRIVQHRSGSPDVVRWMRYDTLGRRVLNVEPNASAGFTTDENADLSTVKAWRYAYDDMGDLVGTSDARGCGVNFFRDMAGRIIAEDFSPCEAQQADYSPPDFVSGTGIETLYRYDYPDPETNDIHDDAGTVLRPTTSLLWGRLASSSDRAAKAILRYDAQGHVTGLAGRIAKPGAPDEALSQRYAPRWYISQTKLDLQDRVVNVTTGATLPELMGEDGTSSISIQYSRRGLEKAITSSYGTLVAARTYAANGPTIDTVLGDAAGTQRHQSYDDLFRLQSIQTFRSKALQWSAESYPSGGTASQQLLLEDYDFRYDAIGNPIEIKDWRLPSEWPEGAAPVTRQFEYDDLYRLTRVSYRYPNGTDKWISPFARENSNADTGINPSPHVAFDQRVREQRFQYDHLGNRTQTTDDASGFFDRSLGRISTGQPTDGPHRLVSASNRPTSGSSLRQGELTTRYDASGNLIDLVVQRNGPCLPAGASCWQRLAYDWDEVGQLIRARRWDLAETSPDERTAFGRADTLRPSRRPNVDLRYGYNASGDRIIKTATDRFAVELHTLYIFSSLELRSTTWDGTDYGMSATTTSVVLSASGIVGRIVYSETDVATQTSGRRRMFLELAEQLGSTALIVDHETGELVEATTYQAYGSVESDYRPPRWGSYREPRKFSGKEDDVEVGLAYFGKRYLSIGLGCWISPDPATIHEIKGSLNPYEYVKGRPTASVDPDGRLAFLAVIAIGIVIGAIVGGGANMAAQLASGRSFRDLDWGSIGVSAGMGGVAGGLMAATIAMGGWGAAKFVFAYKNVAHIALGWAAVGGFTVPIATVVGTTVAGYHQKGPGDTLKWGLAGAEAGLLIAAGGLLGQLTGTLAGWSYNSWFAVATAASGALNGGFAGARQIYRWQDGTGFLAFFADSSWSLTGTTLGNISNLYNLGAGDYWAEESFRKNQQVYKGGFQLQEGYAFTQGNVTSGLEADSSEGLKDHERWHGWQQRLFGPTFQAFYVDWAIQGAVIATHYAAYRYLSGDEVNWWKCVKTISYFDNPFEYNAYMTHNPSGYYDNAPVHELTY